MREDKLAERSMEFAVQIIELTKTLRMRKEFIMANQIGVPVHPSVQISVRHIMRKAATILFPNWRSH